MTRVPSLGSRRRTRGPRINGVWPSIGEAGAGTEVEIWGHGFLNPTVSFPRWRY